MGRGSLGSQNCSFVALRVRLAQKRVIDRQLDHSDVEELPEGNSTLSYLVILYFKHMVRGPGTEVIQKTYPQMLSFQSVIRTTEDNLGRVSVLEEDEIGAV